MSEPNALSPCIGPLTGPLFAAALESTGAAIAVVATAAAKTADAMRVLNMRVYLRECRLVCHHGVRAVILDLCGEPFMDCRDELGIGRLEANARAVLRAEIVDGNPACAGTQLRKPRHVHPVNRRRVGEIAAREGAGFFAQMRTHERDLPRISVMPHYVLHPTVA